MSEKENITNRNDYSNSQTKNESSRVVRSTKGDVYVDLPIENKNDKTNAEAPYSNTNEAVIKKNFDLKKILDVRFFIAMALCLVVIVGLVLFLHFNLPTGKTHIGTFDVSTNKDGSIIANISEKNGRVIIEFTGVGTLEEENTRNASWYLEKAQDTALKEIIVGGEIEKIGECAFDYDNIVSLKLGDNVKEIGTKAFMSCTDLRFVDFGNGVEKIGERAFCQCKLLKQVILPDSLKYIDESAFACCDELTTLKLGSGVLEIGYGAFGECVRLRDVEFPQSLRVIDDGAFSRCESIEYVRIPSGVEVLSDAFAGTNIKEIYLEEGIKTFADGCLEGCEYLERVNIPRTVTEIGKQSFKDCISLSYVIIPNSVSVIGANAFLNTTSIYCEATEIPQGWTSNYANSWCEEDTFVLLGCESESQNEDYKYIIKENKAYITKYFGSDTQVIIPNKLDGCDVVYFGSIFKGNKELACVSLPSTIERIENGAFSDCTKLEAVNLPVSLVYLGEYAFSGCASLKEVDIPSGITEIKRRTFSECTSLERVSLTENLITIGESAFGGCDSLTKIIIPSSVQTMGEYAFYLDYKLEIYCRVTQKPTGWAKDWNTSKVIWGYEGE